jgi:hypothetical protein
MCLTLLGPACDSDSGAKSAVEATAQPGAVAVEQTSAQIAAKGTVDPKQINLDAAVALVRSGEVADGKALEQRINADKLVTVDLDGDDDGDDVRVVERRDGENRTLELQVIPSSVSKVEGADLDAVAVVIATINFKPEADANQVIVTAQCTDVVLAPTVHVITYVEPVSYHDHTIVVADSHFFHWMFVVERDVYVGVHVHEVDHVHVDHVDHVEHVEHVDIVTHGKYKKHGKHKGKGKHKGPKGHGGHGVVIHL